jgi:hypothetical protein
MFGHYNMLGWVMLDTSLPPGAHLANEVGNAIDTAGYNSVLLYLQAGAGLAAAQTVEWEWSDDAITWFPMLFADICDLNNDPIVLTIDPALVGYTQNTPDRQTVIGNKMCPGRYIRAVGGLAATYVAGAILGSPARGPIC